MSPHDNIIEKTRMIPLGRLLRAASLSSDLSTRVYKAGASVAKHSGRILALPLGILLTFTMLFVLPTHALQVERHDFGSGGLFSYVPPKGWTVAEFPGLKFKISHGAGVNGFAPNIVVVDEAYNESLDRYAKDNRDTMQKLNPQVKDLGLTDFKTSEGIPAVRLVTERKDDSGKKELRQIFYFYDAGDKKLVVTCSGLAAGAAALDKTCDAAMSTFSVNRTAK